MSDETQGTFLAVVTNPAASHPQPSISPEQEIERWRMAADIAQALQEAGYGCQLSSQLKLRC